ncbi:MAG: hypothetical protein Q8O52_22320 [Sulfuritalea sp.]|nr:hypothetical protein [Sulfuritalea sp.]
MENIDCAGLGAQGIARRLRGLPPASVPSLHYAKGNYHALAGRAPFSRLIYPVPEAAGLGVRGLVCLYGIESPGLTSCLALADHAVDHLAA